MRKGKKDLEDLLPHFCRVLGIKQAAGFGDIGGYFIEVAPIGYRIARYIENGGTTDDFGSLAKSAAELKACMHFAMDCFHTSRERGLIYAERHRELITAACEAEDHFSLDELEDYANKQRIEK